jgi:hypothetical protein
LNLFTHSTPILKPSPSFTHFLLRFDLIALEPSFRYGSEVKSQLGNVYRLVQRVISASPETLADFGEVFFDGLSPVHH